MLPGHGHRMLHPLDNTYGLALFSRLELVHPELRFLLREDIPSFAPASACARARTSC